MATLHTSRQSSAFTAKSRLKRAVRDHSIQQTKTAIDSNQTEQTFETIPPSFNNVVEKAMSFRQRLTSMEQHQLLLQTVGVYEAWHLVSIQHRPESDVLVAHLMHIDDHGDPGRAIREGRTMQITMDTMGDTRVQYARRPHVNVWERWFGKLTAALA